MTAIYSASLDSNGVEILAGGVKPFVLTADEVRKLATEPYDRWDMEQKLQVMIRKWAGEMNIWVHLESPLPLGGWIVLGESL